MYIVKDWIGNILNYKGELQYSPFGTQSTVPMEFADFDTAWEYIQEHFDIKTWEELHVEEK